MELRALWRGSGVMGLRLADCAVGYFEVGRFGRADFDEFFVGGGEGGSGVRRDGPSMRIVMQRCWRRSSKASTSALLANNSYQAEGSKFVVMMVDTRP